MTAENRAALCDGHCPQLSLDKNLIFLVTIAYYPKLNARLIRRKLLWAVLRLGCRGPVGRPVRAGQRLGAEGTRLSRGGVRFHFLALAHNFRGVGLDVAAILESSFFLILLGLCFFPLFRTVLLVALARRSIYGFPHSPPYTRTFLHGVCTC